MILTDKCKKYYMTEQKMPERAGRKDWDQRNMTDFDYMA
jgi:hypothetical protein